MSNPIAKDDRYFAIRSLIATLGGISEPDLHGSTASGRGAVPHNGVAVPHNGVAVPHSPMATPRSPTAVPHNGFVARST